MRNAEIAEALEELATLYELDGAVSYRVLAYREAARVVRESPVSVAELARQGRATELPGVGKTLAEKVDALLEGGEIPAAEKLKRKYPVSLIDVTHVPGVGAKTARRLYEELGVSNPEELREAASEHRIRALRGLGPKAEANILAALERLGAEGPAERLLLSEVLPVAEELARFLGEHPASERVAVAGSARRMVDTCKDIDLVATATEPGRLAAALGEHELIAEAEVSGPAGARALTHNGIRVDLRIVAPESWGSLLQHFTGSAEHNVELRERAVAMGLSVSEHGIADTRTGEVSSFSGEREVYRRLGLDYIEPELREGWGEIAAAETGELPDLVELDQIRGELHCHTTLSDGHNTVSEMADAARARGYSYLGLTDHSATHGFGNDVQAEALLERAEEVREFNRGRRGFRLLAGTEVNILPDGSPDYDDEVLAQLDWVIASVHTSFNMSSERMTERILAAIRNPHVHCIGHLTGRLLLRREPYELDVDRIFEAAAETKTMLEINGNPRRRDLSDLHARRAARAGVMICVTTDAHQIATLDNMRYGVATARRAWLGPEQIANTRPWGELRRLLSRP